MYRAINGFEEAKRLKAKIGRTRRWGKTVSFVRRGGIEVDMPDSLAWEIANNRQFRASKPVRYYFLVLTGGRVPKWVHSMRGVWRGAHCVVSKNQKAMDRIAKLCTVVIGYDDR